VISHSVAKPLEEVASAAEAIAQGDLSQRAPVSGPHEVRDLARAFNRMAARVGATQRAQRDFIANVSHELKTPLTSIQGFSQAILDGTAADDAMGVERSAQVIYDEAERMRRMVDELLSLARFDAGQVEMAQEPVDVAHLLGQCVERLRPQAEAAGDELGLSVPPELEVTGDADWLAQLFTNLLDNAIRHTRDGQVKVEARRVDDTVEVAFTDTGEGIPSEELSRVFERFYQADKSRQRKGGVGLGLAIAREVARLHGGDIEVESVVGLGSRFTVRLPAQKGQ
jgi:signal transduction histidine kinase